LKSREFLISEVPGISYKESSHFLRNVGVFSLAILDKHILRIMNSIDPSTDMKVTPPRRYLEKEQTFMEYSKVVNMEPGELDLYLWFMATGKVIK
jgi:N-glycosylase/DNA lyase